MIQGFLGLFGNFFFKDVFGFAFDPACQTRFKPLLILLGSFKGFRVLLRPWNPPRMIRHQPFALLIIPLVGPKSCQTSPSHGVFFSFTRDHVWLFFTGGSSLFIPSSSPFFFETSGRCFHGFFGHRNPRHPHAAPNAAAFPTAIKAGRERPEARDRLVAFFVVFDVLLSLSSCFILT